MQNKRTEKMINADELKYGCILLAGGIALTEKEFSGFYKALKLEYFLTHRRS